jgi:hypothetical protein
MDKESHMATKEQLNASLEAFREHRQKLIDRVTLVENIIEEMEMMLGDGGETFKGEYSPGTVSDSPTQTVLSNGKARLSKGALFGKSIGEASVAVLRASAPQPMGVKEILQVLEESGYQFGSGDRYFAVYRALHKDRRPVEVIKQGKLYGLRPRVPKVGTPETPLADEGEG